MKIAIDGYSLSYNNTMGLFTFSSNFVEALGSKYDTVVIAPNNDFITPPAQRFDYIELLVKKDPTRISVAKSDSITKVVLVTIHLLYKLKLISYEIFLILKHQVWLRYLLPTTVKKLSGRADVLLFLNQYAIKTDLNVIHAAVVHDALAWYYYRGDKKLAKSKQIVYGSSLTSLKKFDHIFSISITTKTDLICEFGFSAKKIQVIYENIATRYGKFLDERIDNPKNIIDHNDRLMEKYGLKAGGYILVNNPFNERKNSIAVLHATKIAEKHSCRIAFIGDAKKPREQEIKDSIIRSAKPDIFAFIDVDDSDDLPYLYQSSACFCIFSLKEGFGLPPIEAMASGGLVVSSRVSTMLEFMVGYNVWFVNPFSPTEIATAIDDILNLSESARTKLIAQNDIKMQEFMKNYSWYKIITRCLIGLEAVKKGEPHHDL